MISPWPGSWPEMVLSRCRPLRTMAALMCADVLVENHEGGDRISRNA
jgi:hypothetical protein